MQKHLQTSLPIEISSKTLLNRDLISKDYIIYNGRLIWANPNAYLQGSGTQYINTGFLYKTTSKLEVSAVFSPLKTLFGFETANGRFAIGFGDIFAYIRLYRNSATSTVDVSTGTHIYKTENNRAFIDGTLVYTGGTAVDSTLSAYLLAINVNNGPVNIASDVKLKWSKMYDNNVLVKHLVPVPQGLEIGNLTCPSNGMFDIVNQQFYGNAGTGDFTYGKDE